MTARYPLVLNGTSMQELQNGDSLTTGTNAVATGPLTITGAGWQTVNGTTTSQYFKWGDGTTAYAQMGGYYDSATTGHLEFYTLTSGTPTEYLRIANTGAFGLSGANYGTSGQALLSQGSGAAPVWGTAGITTGKSIAMSMIFGF